MEQLWLIGVPGEGSPGPSSEDEAVRKLEGFVRGLCETSRWRLPPRMKIGTLDTLMGLSDDLSKVDDSLQGLAQKIHRQYHDVDGESAPQLLVDSMQPVRYVTNFNWDVAKYPRDRSLADLSAMIASNGASIEEELRELTAAYSDNRQAMVQEQRRRGGNLMVADLADVVTPELVADATGGLSVEDVFIHTSFLTTACVVMSKDSEKEWKASYEKLAADAVQAPSGRRGGGGGGGGGGGSSGATGGTSKISPVVPGSAKRLKGDKDGYVLYTVVILRKFLEEFRAACKEQRFQVRDFALDSRASADAESSVDELSRLENEDNRLRTQVTRWCKTHYGEAVIAMAHVKALRVFVESVLRYGVPPNFAPVLLQVASKNHKKVRAALQELYGHLTPSGVAEDGSGGGGGAAGGPSAMASLDTKDFFPYVFLPVNVHK